MRILLNGAERSVVEGLLLQTVALVDPGVAGGADGDVGRAVFVGEVGGVADAHRTVVAGGGARHGEASGLAVERRELLVVV